MNKITFVNGQAPSLSAANLNQLQTNIENALADTIVPSANNSKNLGSTARQYQTVYTKGINFNNNNAIRLNWTGTRLGLYVDETFIGYFNISND